MAKKTCSVDGCSKKHQAQGFCAMHYQRLRSRGKLPNREKGNEICSVAGCGSHIYARNFCNLHWMRWRRHGDPNKVLKGKARQGEAQKFLFETVISYDGGECLIWPFSRNRQGYAVFHNPDGSGLVHYYVCERANGPAPDGSEAAHSCGNGHLGCVTGRHLRWASRSENQLERADHGTDQRGEKHPHHKLTEDNVREIRKLAATRTQTDVALIFGVSQTTIRAILIGRTWAWLD